MASHDGAAKGVKAKDIHFNTPEIKYLEQRLTPIRQQMEGLTNFIRKMNEQSTQSQGLVSMNLKEISITLQAFMDALVAKNILTQDEFMKIRMKASDIYTENIQESKDIRDGFWPIDKEINEKSRVRIKMVVTDPTIEGEQPDNPPVNLSISADPNLQSTPELVELAKELQGKKSGDKGSLVQNLAKDHPDPQLAGKTLQINYEVIGVKEQIQAQTAVATPGAPGGIVEPIAAAPVVATVGDVGESSTGQVLPISPPAENASVDETEPTPVA